MTYKEGLPIIYIHSKWSDFLLEQSFLPQVPFFHTKINDMETIKDEISRYISEADGLIVLGGKDIDPGMYTTGPENKTSENFQDWYDYYLIRAAMERNLPVLAVCRGFQMLNVVQNGTLIQHLDENAPVQHIKYTAEKQEDGDFDNESVETGKVHPVDLKKDGILYDVLNKNTIMVTSIHHQGVDKLGEGLQVEAVAPDGLIEAVSIKNKKILGMQWHPELDLKDEDQIKIIQTWLSWVS